MNERKRNELLKIEMKRMSLKEARRMPAPSRMSMQLLGKRRAFTEQRGSKICLAQ